jgi:FKBP-type peptidyl-prolyl cis-trans isomerase FkpA
MNRKYSAPDFRAVIRSARRALLPTLLLTLGAGCNDDPVGPLDPTELTFAPALNVDLAQMTRTSSGLYYRDEVPGTGAIVQVGDRVTVNYTGWLHTGLKFDSSVDRQQPLTVPNIGNANLIAGWNEGIPGMRVGGRRLLVIPSQLGYGGEPNGIIPPHSTLVFRVDMLAATR